MVANKYAEFCGWCDTYISVDDLENKKYKTMYKSKSVLGMIDPRNEFKVCIKCLGKIAKWGYINAYIKSVLKEKKRTNKGRGKKLRNLRVKKINKTRSNKGWVV